MITLASDCLVFELSSGESIPFSAEMISVELTGESTGDFDPEFVKQASNAVFHYFKHELGRITITVAEFAGALERVLRGFQFEVTPSGRTEPRVLESDLRRLLLRSGLGGELFFYPVLRDELRLHLEQTPRVIRFRGLRGCVKQLAGARRWCDRCRTLQEQLIDYLRGCLSVEAARKDCSLVVE